MPKLKYDNTGVESRSFETPPPGVYRCKVKEMTVGQTKNGDPMLTVVFAITAGDHAGAQLWERIVLSEASQWKLDQFTSAVKLPKKGQLDTDKPAALPELMVRVKHRTYEGEAQADVAAMLPYNPTGAEPEDDTGEEPEEESDGEGQALVDMSVSELREYAEELGLEARKGMSKASLIELIEADTGEIPDDPDEEEPEADADDPGYDDWSIADLKADLAERGLATTGPKSALVKRLREDDSDDPFDG